MPEAAIIGSGAGDEPFHDRNRPGLMEGHLDVLGPDGAFGWAYGGADPLRVELRVAERTLIATTAQDFRADLVPRRDGHCAFTLRFARLRDAIGVLSRGALRVVAIDAEGHELVLGMSDTLLPAAVLVSRDRLLGDRDCASALADLRLLARNAAPAACSPVFVAQLCDVLRLHFPPEQRPAEFNSVAADLAEAAGRHAAAAFYRRPAAPPPSRAMEVAWQPVEVGHSYACFADLAAPVTPTLRCDDAELVSGGRFRGHLRKDGPLERGEDPSALSRSVWVSVNGFDAPGWVLGTPAGATCRAIHLYLVNFEQIRRNADAGGVLVIDQSEEGSPSSAAFIDVLNDTLADFGLAPRQVVLLTQNHAFTATLAGADARFAVAVAHAYFPRAVALFTQRFPDDAAASAYIETIFDARRTSAAPRKFTCLNFTPRWMRWAVGLSLFAHGHTNDGFFSFPGTVSPRPIEPTRPEDILPRLAHRDIMIAAHPAFVAACPFIVDVDVRTGEPPVFVYPERPARESFLHIVTETEMSAGDVLRVTEKIITPILMLQPFVIFGNERSLALLHGMGFKTFGGVFDESYDAIQSPTERFDAVERLMLDLLAQDTEQLRALADRAAPICVHNFLHLVSAWPALVRHGMTGRLLRRIAAMSPPATAPGA